MSSTAGEATRLMPRAGWRAMLMAVGLLAATASGSWLLVHRAGDRYLAASGPAKWILYPAVFNPFSSPAAEQSTVFRRTFRVDQPPGPTPLKLRGYRWVTVNLNGETLVSTRPETDWRQPLELDIGPDLRPGENRLEVEVANDLGPPALWLELATGGEHVVSDASWESSRLGATWLPARLADEAPELRPGNPIAGGERSLDSFRAHVGTILLFVVLAAAALLARGRIVGWLASVAPRILPQHWALALIGAWWLVLFFVNWQSLTFPLGFDSTEHLDYVRYVQERSAIPLANEGTEMQQPPLYYLLGAGLLSLCGVTADGKDDCVFLLRAFGLATALAGLYFVYRILARLFAGRPAARAAGVLTAACLPIPLYLAHYISNDLLAGTLGSAAVLMTVVTLQDRVTTASWLAGLGALLGAGVMAKLTFVPVAGAILLALAAAAALRDRSPRLVARSAGLPLIVCVLVCGWWFVRNYQHFGRPIVGTHDPISGYQWWQDPGYADAAQFLRFGRALTEPFNAASAGLPDGLYSTCWGDGGEGGLGGGSRPPWNYDLMAAGYLLAIVPTALFVAGYVAAFAEWVRRPSAAWGLMLALPVAAAAAMAYHYARYPFYCHIKAFYAAPALTAGCAFVARGFDPLTRLGRAGRWAPRVVGMALGTWALTSLFAFVVSPSSADTLAWEGAQMMKAGDRTAARQIAERAVAAEPDNPAALTLLGRLMLAAQQPSGAIAQFRKALATRPDDRDARVNLTLALSQTRATTAAIEELAETTRRAPDTPEPYVALAALLEATGDSPGAVRVARDGLRVAPTGVALHAVLARCLLRLNETAEAVRHYGFAVRFDPDPWPELIGLAWVRAAHEDARYRNGAEAVALASRAVEMTRRQWAPARRALAAALAETGDYEKARNEIEALLAGAVPLQDPTLPAQLRRDLERYKARQPLREPPQALAGR